MERMETAGCFRSKLSVSLQIGANLRFSKDERGENNMAPSPNMDKRLLPRLQSDWQLFSGSRPVLLAPFSLVADHLAAS